MPNDIVERLRGRDDESDFRDLNALIDEAADEIERLRGVMQGVINNSGGPESAWYSRDLSAALSPERNTTDAE